MPSMSHQTPPACQEDVWMQRPTTYTHKYIHTPVHTQLQGCMHKLQNKTTQLSLALSLSHTYTHTDLISIILFISLPSRCRMRRGAAHRLCVPLDSPPPTSFPSSSLLCFLTTLFSPPPISPPPPAASTHWRTYVETLKLPVVRLAAASSRLTAALQ